MTDVAERARIDPALIASIKRGAVDTHCHSGPSVMPRALDHVEAMREAGENGFSAIVIKDHYYSAAPFTPVLNKYFGDCGVTAIGGLALNNAVGGLNPYAVEHALRIGGRVFWLPTFSSKNHIDRTSGHKAQANKDHWGVGMTLEPTPLRVLDDQGALLPEVEPILKLIAQGDAVLCGGHLSLAEIWKVFRRARELGVKRFLVNHPTFLIGASDEDLRDLADFGAYLEHSICMFDPDAVNKYTPADLKRLIDAAGVDATILGSDLGQDINPHPMSGFDYVVPTCLELGYTPQEVRKMIGDNPRKLLGLEPLPAL